MVDSLKNALLINKIGLDERLISSEEIAQISQIAELLPTFPTVLQAGLECHLGLSEPKADFMAAFSTSNCGREALARGYQPLASLDNNPVWSRIYDFCEHWTDANSPLYKEVDRVWLEFDLVKPQLSEVPEPSLFFGTAEGIKKETENTSLYDDSLPDNISNNHSWVTDQALRLLLNKPLPDLVKRNMLTCFNSLPREGKVFQIGVMLPRKIESQAVRLCISNIAIAKIPQYLSDIGWQGSISNLESVLVDISRFTDFICLNFTVGNTIFPKMGLECYGSKQLKISSEWELFLDYLVEKQLCIPDKADAILNYPGYSVEKSYRDLWPSNLTNASTFVFPSFKSTLVRYLNHIKIVYQPNKPLEAKAYLWLEHLWLSSQGVFER